MAFGKSRTINLKSDVEVDALRNAAALVGKVLAEVGRRLRPGASTLELDEAAEQIVHDAGARAAFKGYQFDSGTAPFPGTLCTSVNDVVVHGIPSADAILEEGDILSVDCGVELEGFYGDYAYTFAVGEISEEKARLLQDTKQSLLEAIHMVRSGNRVGDIGYTVQSYCESRGLGVVRDLVGHGIGRSLHEDPQVPNVGRRGRGKKLKPGLTLCIEPMINLGTPEVTVDSDGWTVRTADGSPSAHFEHTVAVRKGEAEVLSSYEPIEEAMAETPAAIL